MSLDFLVGCFSAKGSKYLNNVIMLTSTKRRVLNVICLTLAIASVSFGLVLRYDNAMLEEAVVMENNYLQEGTSETESDLFLEASSSFTYPNN
ncbi:MAG: hypothetical protein ACI82Q_001304 [Nonlabens sp.]|jgi:hypothetical protein